MSDENIAPVPELVHYLAIFHRFAVALTDAVERRDVAGILMGVWIADTLHNVPGMLRRYDPAADWNGPVQLAEWMREFPKRVRKAGAPDELAAACDAIFSPEGCWQE